MTPLAEHAPPLWRRLIARLDPRAYLTIHIVVGLAVCLLTAWVFAALLDSVREKDVLVHRDEAVANWFHLNGTPFGYRIFVIISLIGSPPAMAALFAAAVLYLWRAKQRTLIVAWVLSYIGGTILDGVMKEVVRRPRPEYAMKFLHYNSWSFPSGHSMGSLIGFAMLAFTIIRMWPVKSTRSPNFHVAGSRDRGSARGLQPHLPRSPLSERRRRRIHPRRALARSLLHGARDGEPARGASPRAVHLKAVHLAVEHHVRGIELARVVRHERLLKDEPVARVHHRTRRLHLRRARLRELDQRPRARLIALL